MKPHKIHRSDRDIDQCLEMYRTGEYTKAALSRHFNVTVPTITNWVQGKTRTTKRTDQENYVKAKAVRKEYRRGMKTQVELARKFGVSQPTISCWLRDVTRRDETPEGKSDA